MCNVCGFVGYAPRPTESDLQAKYEFLSAHEARAPRSPGLDALRSSHLLRWVQSYVSSEAGTLLDLGGGRGELLSAFVAAGFSAAVVDYPRDPMAGVEWCGSTLADVPQDRMFGVVIASHVFEHLAEPIEAAKDVLRHLAPGGLFFVEVPLEFVGGVPRMREPVTHINFFCASSLSALLQRAGFEVVRGETVASLFASGAYRYAVRVVARRPRHVHSSEQSSSQARFSAAEARALLSAGRWSKILRVLRAPKVLLPKVSR